MRTIKFRAWDKDRKTMINIASLCFGNDGVFYYSSDNFKDADMDGIILMQYTNCKDRNNVEIYEGSVVKYSVPNPNYCFVDEVIFGRIKHHTDHGYYMREYAGFGFKNEHNGGGEEGQIMNTYSLKNMEVIGDIYSNPKLLKEKK